MPDTRKIKKFITKFCSFDLRRLFPIIQWLPSYRFSKLRCDIIAGIAVSLFVIPHGLIHAVIAGLDLQYGLYTSFPAMFVYVFVGTCKDMNVGNTVITAIFTNRYAITENVRPDIASSLAFLVGLVLIFVAIFRLGFIVRFISLPVISGFVSASAVILVLIQSSFLLGLSRPPRATYLKVKHLFTNIKNVRLSDAILGISCIVITLLLQKLALRKLPEDASKCRKMLHKIMVAVSVARNAVVVLLSVVVVYVYYKIKEENAFITVGRIPSGLPELKMPLHAITIDGNKTIEVTELITEFGSGLGIIPLVIITQEIAIAKSLARRNRYKIDPFQEIIAAGLGNVFVSFFSGFPVTGSLSRSAVNSMSGAQTCFSGVVASLIVVLAIECFGPLFIFLPFTCLAAISMTAIINLFDYKLIRKLWHVNKLDLMVWMATFWGCLYEFEIGILIGIGLSLTFIMFREFNPRLDINVDKEAKTLSIALKGGIWYSGIEAVADKIAKELEKEKRCIDVVVIDCKNMLEVDYTVIHGLNEIIADCMVVNVQVRFANVNGTKIRKHLDDAGFLKSNPVLFDDENVERMEDGGILLDTKVIDGKDGAETEVNPDSELQKHET